MDLETEDSSSNEEEQNFDLTFNVRKNQLEFCALKEFYLNLGKSEKNK